MYFGNREGAHRFANCCQYLTLISNRRTGVGAILRARDDVESYYSSAQEAARAAPTALCLVGGMIVALTREQKQVSACPHSPRDAYIYVVTVAQGGYERWRRHPLPPCFAHHRSSLAVSDGPLAAPESSFALLLRLSCLVVH